jgi:hypothetical protein
VIVSYVFARFVPPARGEGDAILQHRDVIAFARGVRAGGQK